MKKQWEEIKVITVIFVLWRIVLEIIGYFSRTIIPLYPNFLGINHWTNFDGGHYISIAAGGYHIYQQAFFPFYPILINLLSKILSLPVEMSALAISHVSIFIGIILFYKLAILEHVRSPMWTIIFLLLFPTSFFFIAAYNESLFLVLAVGMIYSLKKKRYVIAGILGMLASATRLFGVFLIIFPVVQLLTLPKKKIDLNIIWPILLIPLGLIIYMIYLQYSTGDAFAFIHLQSKFGAGRSSGEIILLPQVFWRYIRIFMYSSRFTLSYIIAIFEMVVFIFSLFALWIGWKKFKLDLSYIIYSFFVLIVPTFSGTLSSIPRYAISAFPLFFIGGNMHNKWMKLGLAAILASGLVLSTALFLSGYFIA